MYHDSGSVSRSRRFVTDSEMTSATLITYFAGIKSARNSYFKQNCCSDAPTIYLNVQIK